MLPERPSSLQPAQACLHPTSQPLGLGQALTGSAQCEGCVTVASPSLSVPPSLVPLPWGQSWQERKGGQR